MEESRGKRRKQANPRRNRVDTECSLGSEGEDEGGVWGKDVPDERNGQDKMSLTPSEGTEPGSPVRFTHANSVSPHEERWDEPESAAFPTTPDPDNTATNMYTQKDAHFLENWARYDFLMQLSKAPRLPHPRHSQQLNGSITSYHTTAVQVDTSATLSPGIQESPDRKADIEPVSPDATWMPMQVCPYCHRSYQCDSSLREHIKMCPERDRGPRACPLCGYSTPYVAQMERHLALHSQAQEKNPVSDTTMENRKFKCTQCGKAFKYKHHLKEHLRIHSGEKPYECSNCKKRFSHSGSYSSHLSSKKCLSGGGSGNAAHFNGHSHPVYLFPSPASPPVVGTRNISRGKSSPYAPLNQCFAEQPPNQGQEPITPTARAPELGSMWDPAAAIRAELFKGTTLLPFLQTGDKFEHLLQEMLRKEVGREELRGSREEKDEGEDVFEREGKSKTPGVVTCQWCFQPFPNDVVLEQHEKYLCRRRDRQEGAQLRHREESPLNFSHASQQPSSHKTPTTPNGLTRDPSSPQRTSWHSVPQQILVPLQSPVHLRQEPPRTFWPSKESGSPRNSGLMSPTSPSVQEHRLAAGFSSPPCLDLSTASSPCRPNRHRPSPRPEGSQSEPLDLSIPKKRTSSDISRESRDRACNGGSPQLERKDVFRRLTPPSQHQVGRSYTPLFGSAIFSNYPLFNPIIPSGLAGMGHTPLPLTPPTPSPGFLSPMAYMMEGESETVLKRMQQERSVMGEAISRGCLDYHTLVEEGLEGENGPARKRLRKTEEGLYACDICDKSFQKSSSLLRHKYEHTGKRPHECQICKKAFKHKHHLIEHSRLHSGEKPYQCDKCGKRFSHSGSYSQHMNHRYAFCSRDHDPDGPGDELIMGDAALYPSPRGELHPEAEGGLEEAGAFLSDSSLDGAPLGFKEEDEEEEEEENSLSNHAHERRLERSVGLEQTGEESEKEEETAEAEEEETKENHHFSKIKAEQNGEEERDREETNVQTV